MRDPQPPPISLVRQYGTYLAGMFFQKVASFALIPLYTAWLSTADYGAIELLSTFAGLAGLFVALGVPGAVNKCYHRDCGDARERAELVGTSVLFTLPIALVIIVSAFVVDRSVAVAVFAHAEWAPYVRLTLISLALMQTSMLPMELMRTLGRAGQYVRFSLLQMGVQTVLTIVLLVRLHLGVPAVLLGNIGGYAAIQLGAAGVLWRHCRPHFSWHHLRQLAAFGLLLAPISACAWIVNVSDRFFLQRLASDAEVGLYALGYKFGMLVELVLVLPFQKAWNPYYFSMADRPEARAIFARVLTYYVAVLSLGVALMAVCGAAAVRLLAHADFQPAARIIPYIAVSYGLSGLVMCLSTGLIVTQRARVVAGIAAAGAVVNMVFNILLIPGGGMMGAAQSTLLTFLVTSGLTLWAVRRWYPVPIETRRLVTAAGTAVLLGVIASGICVEAPQIELLTRGAVVLALPAVLLLLGFFSTDEVAAIKAAAARVGATMALPRRKLAAVWSLSTWGRGSE